MPGLAADAALLAREKPFVVTSERKCGRGRAPADAAAVNAGIGTSRNRVCMTEVEFIALASAPPEGRRAVVRGANRATRAWRFLGVIVATDRRLRGGFGENSTWRRRIHRIERCRSANLTKSLRRAKRMTSRFDVNPGLAGQHQNCSWRNHMRNQLINTLARFRRSEEGVTLVEYGVAVAFAVAAGGLMVTWLVPAFTTVMTNAAAAM